MPLRVRLNNTYKKRAERKYSARFFRVGLVFNLNHLLDIPYKGMNALLPCNLVYLVDI